MFIRALTNVENVFNLQTFKAIFPDFAFKRRLSMNNNTRDEKSNPADGSAQADVTPGKSRILLAEDDGAMRRLLEVVLKRAGYEVTSAEDGLQAMQAIGTQKFDLVVLDAIMPNLSGLELCRIFRANSDWQKTPLILMSGMEPDSNCEANIHLLKSADLQEELLAAVSNLLASRG
jgi:CheY-like chemotaxis protein